jgi:hypothetical protein
MLSLALSTVASVAASYFIKRHLEEMGIPQGMTRNIAVFVLAAAVSYGVVFLVDWL